MAIICSDGHGVWGFELPTKGWHDVKIHDSIEVKGTKKDEAKKMLCIPFCFDGSDRPSLTVYCLLSTIPGLRRIVDVVIASGVNKELLKDKKLDLLAGVDEEVIKSDKFIHYVMAKLPGKAVSLNIDHGTYEVAGDDGVLVKKAQANIMEIKPVGSGKATAVTVASQPTATEETAVQSQPEDTGGW